MLNLLNQYKQIVEENKSRLLDFANPPDNIPTLETTISNNDLLVSDLTKIFEKENAKYIPVSVTSAVSSSINRTIEAISAFGKDLQNQSQFGVIIKAMDELYSCCLQYGLMTFGFPGKEETKMIESVRSAVNDITIQTKNLRKIIKTNNEKAESSLKVFEQKIQTLDSDAQQRLIKFEENLQTSKTSAETTVSKITGMINVVSDFQNISKATSDKIIELHTTSQQTVEKIKEIESQSKSNQQNVTITTAKINEQLQTAATQAADTKAKLESATQSLASIEEQKKNILNFYAEIEKQRGKMIDMEKAANAKFNELQQNTETTINQMKEETTSVISTNQKLQGEIQEHLARAVSVSLFKAFGERQKTLFKSRFVWLCVLAATLVFAFLLVQYIVKNVSGGTNMAFFIRLSLAGPLIFAMYFAASQYRKDRQAEEEYAFKSAISISLVPYRDLLKKMREDNVAETEFVQKLMEEVFDNPARYIYQPKKNGKDDSDMEELPLHELLDSVQKLSGDQISKTDVIKFITDLLQKITKTKT